MLQNQIAGEYGRRSIATTSKLQSPRASREGRVYLRFNHLLTENPGKPFDRNLSGLEISLTPKQSSYGFSRSWGFKVQCVVHTVASPSKSSIPVNGRKHTYGEVLRLSLKSLECDDNVNNALSPYVKNLGPKEMTVILKHQLSWEKVIRVFDWMKLQKQYVPNVIHYNVVLRALGLAQQWDELRLHWIEMADSGVMPTSNTYSTLIHVYGKAGLAVEALLWIKHMRIRGIFPDEVVMHTVIAVLKDAGEFDRADRFYSDWCNGKVELEGLNLDNLGEDMSPSGSKPVSLKQFLSTQLFKVGGRSQSSNTTSKSGLPSVVAKPLSAETYTTLIDLYGKAGRLDEAANIFTEMLRFGVAPTVCTFNALIHTCGTYGHLSEAEALLDKMEERGIHPDIRTYNTFVSLYAESGEVDAALKWYRKIQEVGLRPNFVTYRSVVRMLCDRQKVEEAESIIKEFHKRGARVDEFPITNIVQMYVNEGLLYRAKTFLWKCQSHGKISSRTYAAIIDIYAEKGLWPEAETVFNRTLDSMGAKKDVFEYNVMIKAYGKAKQYDKAFSLFKSMKSRGTWPDEVTYNSLIQMLAGGDMLDLAVDLLVEMQGAGMKPKCATFSAIIASYVRLGRVSDAVDLFQEMQRAGVEPNVVVFGSLINGFAKAGLTEESLHYYQMMEEKKIPVNQVVLTALFKAYSKLGYFKGAKEVYDKMRAMEGGPDLIASNSMINLCGDLGIISEAKVIFDDLRQKGQANEFSYAIMMNLYASMQMLDEAIAIAEDMEKHGLLKNCASFTQVMACHVSIGHLAYCGKLLQQMLNRNIPPDNGTFKALFKLLKKGDLPKDAVHQLGKAYRSNMPHSREAVIACALSTAGLHAQALESCETLTKGKTCLDTFVYNAALHVYGASGDVDKALSLVMRMQDGGVQTDIVTSMYLLKCYGKAHMVEGINRIYSELKHKETEPNESLFQAVIDAYRTANRHDLAELVSRELNFALEGYKPSDSEEEQEFSDSENGHRF